MILVPVVREKNIKNVVEDRFMKKYLSKADEIEVERAVSFLIDSVSKNNNNSKPVMLHSLRVAMYLLKKGYEKIIIQAALLHDLVEDAEVSLDNLEKEFGIEVSSLIDAVSYRVKIEDKTEMNKEMFERCISHGRDALVLKAADLLDNSFYIKKVEKREDRVWLFGKMKYFIDKTYLVIRDESVYKELVDTYNDIKIYTN